MATSSLRPFSLTHCLSRRTILTNDVRRNVSPSIRFKSTDVWQASKDSLSWSEYLAIRRRKRRWEIVGLLLCRLIAFETVLTRISLLLLLGVDYTMRAGRVSGRCGLLWGDGIRRNEARHGASTFFIRTSQTIHTTVGYRPASIFRWRDTGLHGHVPMFFAPVSPLTIFPVPRRGIPRWPYNWFDALARNAPTHHGSYRGTRPRVPPAYRQKSRRSYGTKCY
jgi:hypothetical protein